MKQKIVMEVPMNSNKHRREAMKIAAVANGVNFVQIEGADKVVVIGDEVDSVKLVSALKKKFGHVMLVSVNEEKGKSDEKKEAETGPTLPAWSYSYIHHPPPAYEAIYHPPPAYEAIYAPSPTACSIL